MEHSGTITSIGLRTTRYRTLLVKYQIGGGTVPTTTGIVSYTRKNNSGASSSGSNLRVDITLDASNAVRTGTTTHQKSLGVNYIIKF